MGVHGFLLAESPASADGLVELLVAVGQAEESHVGAALQIDPKPCHRRLGDEHSGLSFDEVEDVHHLMTGERPADGRGDLTGLGRGASVGFMLFDDGFTAATISSRVGIFELSSGMMMLLVVIGDEVDEKGRGGFLLPVPLGVRGQG